MGGERYLHSSTARAPVPRSIATAHMHPCTMVAHALTFIMTTRIGASRASPIKSKPVKSDPANTDISSSSPEEEETDKGLLLQLRGEGERQQEL